MRFGRPRPGSSPGAKHVHHGRGHAMLTSTQSDPPARGPRQVRVARPGLGWAHDSPTTEYVPRLRAWVSGSGATKQIVDGPAREGQVALVDLVRHRTAGGEDE